MEMHFLFQNTIWSFASGTFQQYRCWNSFISIFIPFCNLELSSCLNFCIGGTIFTNASLYILLLLIDYCYYCYYMRFA
ncbi:unnamed protein product [Callosobruchus maculatus]|uniref:Uncharacterized protein n=1 Tax=Callosobruchus maculatus TaxID=64391 RepID=A0A653CAH0_CALMS|nr:unnamed protein product [Callosobruchus maculatus]